MPSFCIALLTSSFRSASWNLSCGRDLDRILRAASLLLKAKPLPLVLAFGSSKKILKAKPLPLLLAWGLSKKNVTTTLSTALDWFLKCRVKAVRSSSEVASVDTLKHIVLWEAIWHVFFFVTWYLASVADDSGLLASLWALSRPSLLS